MDNKNKSKLRLVSNNGPVEHKSKYVPVRLLIRQQEEHQAVINDLIKYMENHKKKIEETDAALRRARKYVLIGFAGLSSLTVGSILYSSWQVWRDNPEQIIPIRDLNQDGITDAFIVKRDNYKVPMYGIRTHRGIEYVNAENMEKRPGNIVDYESIEEWLNEDSLH